MPNVKGTYLGGVRDLQGLKNRCRVHDGDSGCWVWMGGCSHGAPSVNLILPGGKRASVNGRRAALYLKSGKWPEKIMVAVATSECDESMCCNPKHAKLITRGELNAINAKSPKFRLKMMMHGMKNRPAMAKITIEQVREIRASNDPTKVVAALYGISESNVSMIRRNITWRDDIGHGVVVGSSVFNLVKAA